MKGKAGSKGFKIKKMKRVKKESRGMSLKHICEAESRVDFDSRDLTIPSQLLVQENMSYQFCALPFILWCYLPFLQETLQ